MKCLRSLILALSAFVMFVPHADAATLYAATASGSPGDLYKLDLATGASLEHVGPLNDAAGTNYPITGMAVHPVTKVLYGSTGNSPDETASLFVRINPKTAQVTVIGSFNPGNPGTRDATMTDLAFDNEGNLYGIGSVGGPQLYSIDIATGQATVIGNTGLTSTTGGGLAISPTGTFYGTPTASRYGTYDSGTGAYTNITNPTKPGGGGAYAALEFHPTTGVLYGLNSAPGSPPPTYLVTIDPPTGTVTNVGQSVDAIDAIAIIPEPRTLALLLASVFPGLFSARRHVKR
jgi:hypothetical protein